MSFRARRPSEESLQRFPQTLLAGTRRELGGSYVRRQDVLRLHFGQPNRTIYVGVSNDLARRVAEHRSGGIKGFTRKYKLHRLFYFEETDDIWAALEREKEIKGWRRSKKLALIRGMNPTFRDLVEDWDV